MLAMTYNSQHSLEANTMLFACNFLCSATYAHVVLYTVISWNYVILKCE